MPRKGENIYKRKDGRWEGRLIVARFLDGTAKYRSVYGKTYTEVKRKLQREKALHPSTITKTSSPTKESQCLSQFTIEWLQSMKPRIKEASWNKYCNLVERYILPQLGACRPAQLTFSKIEKFAQHLLLNGGINNAALSAKTVMDTLSVLKGVFRYAANNYGLALCDLRQISIHSKERQMRVLNHQEQEKLVEYLCENPSLKNTGILVALFTGVRIGELCALKWESIHLDTEVIHISHTMQRMQKLENRGGTKTHIVITAPKSSCSIREIPIPGFLINILKKQVTANRCFLLSGLEQKQIEPRNLQNHFKNVLKKAGIPPANFHALRHTFATRSIELGFDIKSLSEILGHANVNITLNKYVHPSMKLKRENMEKLSSLIAVN